MKPPKEKVQRELVERARKDGFRLGLRTAHTMLRKAKGRQALKGKNTNESADADVKAQYEHCASVLHDLCLRLQEQIEKAS